MSNSVYDLAHSKGVPAPVTKAMLLMQDRIIAQAAEIERLREIVAIMHTAFAAYADSPAKQEAITLAGKEEQ
jgi:hypothetical protein